MPTIRMTILRRPDNRLIRDNNGIIHCGTVFYVGAIFHLPYRQRWLYPRLQPTSFVLLDDGIHYRRELKWSPYG